MPPPDAPSRWWLPASVVAHALLGGLLVARGWWSLLLLLGWLMAWAATSEPTPPRGTRHLDVVAFMRSDLGKLLTERRFWVPAGMRGWVLAVLPAILLGIGFGIGWRSKDTLSHMPPWRWVIACVWSAPPLVLAAGFLVEQILLAPIVVLGVSSMGLLFAITGTFATGTPRPLLIFLSVVCGVAMLLWVIDLLRLVWRTWDE